MASPSLLLLNLTDLFIQPSWLQMDTLRPSGHRLAHTSPGLETWRPKYHRGLSHDRAACRDMEEGGGLLIKHGGLLSYL